MISLFPVTVLAILDFLIRISLIEKTNHDVLIATVQ